jgi:hypothetical protein
LHGAGWAAKTGWKAAKKGTGWYLRGMFGKMEKPNLAQKAQRFITRGGTVAGLGAGGYAGYKAATAPRSRPDYTTFLRNNLIAGNIQPQELNPQDLQSVRQLGMR